MCPSITSAYCTLNLIQFPSDLEMEYESLDLLQYYSLRVIAHLRLTDDEQGLPFVNLSQDFIWYLNYFQLNHKINYHRQWSL